MSGFQAASLFLVSLIFNLFIFSLWLRIALRYLRFSALNPVSKIVYQITNPVIRPLSSLINKPRPEVRFDWAAIIGLVLTVLIKVILLSLIAFGTLMPISFLIIYVGADLIIQPCDFLFYLILIQVIISWVNPSLQHPALSVIRAINAPFLRFVRMLIPDIAGLDFSPFVVLITLKVMTLFLRFSLPWPLL